MAKEVRGVNDKDSAEQEGNSSFSISNNGFLIDHLGITGFSVVCAWHFLIIFSAGPTINAGDATGRDLIYQLTLYFSLGISYVVLQLLSKPIFSFLSKDNNRGWNRASLAFGGFASASTVFMISTSNAGFSPIAIASWAVLGLSEAFLMLPWLQLPRVNGGHETESPVNLAFNMGIGGVLAFIIGNLAAPYSFIAVAALPIISCVTLAPIWHSTTISNSDVRLRVSTRQKLFENSHFIFYGICFGLCQYIFSAESGDDSIISFIVNNCWPICGVVVSAVLIMFVSSRGLAGGHVIMIQHVSSLVFIVGILGSTYFIASLHSLDSNLFRIGLLVCEIVCLAGFNTFDFGFMVFAFFKASKFKAGFTNYICFNRAALYLSMGVGVLCGMGFQTTLGSLVPNHMIIEVSIAIILISTSMLPFFDRYMPIDSPLTPQGNQTQGSIGSEANHASKILEDHLESIAEIHGLSKREREVFHYLAHEKSATDIQQELGISIHTVKTHMSSIYRKLNVHSAKELKELINTNGD